MTEFAGKYFIFSPYTRTHTLLILLFNLFLFSSTYANAKEFATLSGNIKNFTQEPLIVYLEPVLKNKKTAPQENKTISLISKNNNFEPAFQVIQRGSVLDIKNNDPILHNTHVSQNKMTLFNVATPTTNTIVKKVIPRTGLFDVACDLHPWMKASIAVITSPYYSVIKKAGEFQIDKIIPGKYILHTLRSKEDKAITILNLKANSLEQVSF